MGRANNVARSLIIMSKQQGIDPTKIDGQDFAGNLYPENRPMQGDTPYLDNPPSSPESSTPNPGAPGPDNRSPGPGGKSHGHGNPYGGGKSESGA